MMVLVNYGAKEHYRVKHYKNEFANNHINGIENFWGYCKKFKGIKRDNFILHLKDREFRWTKDEKLNV